MTAWNCFLVTWICRKTCNSIFLLSWVALYACISAADVTMLWIGSGLGMLGFILIGIAAHVNEQASERIRVAAASICVEPPGFGMSQVSNKHAPTRNEHAFYFIMFVIMSHHLIYTFVGVVRQLSLNSPASLMNRLWGLRQISQQV